MSAFHPSAHQDPIARLGRRARWSWRRAERRVVADYERAVSDALRALATTGAPVLEVETGGAPAGTGSSLGFVRLVLPGWRLLVAGVAPAPREALSAASGARRLVRAGRYGRFWWIAVAEGGNGLSGRTVVLGSHVRLMASGGGRGQSECPAPVGPAASAPGPAG